MSSKHKLCRSVIVGSVVVGIVIATVGAIAFFEEPMAIADINPAIIETTSVQAA